MQLEETKKVESQCIPDEEGRMLRDKGRIRERWVRFFRSLLNSKSDMINADIPKRIPQHPVASALGIEPTEEEIATAMKAMANAKAVGRGSTIGEGGDTTISSPGRSRKQPLPGMRLQDPLHGR